MTTEVTTTQLWNRLSEQGKVLERQDGKLEEIRDTLKQLAVQDEQIKNLENNQTAMWSKIDALNQNGGVLDQIKTHQASCPRHQLKWLWITIIPQGFLLVALSLRILFGSIF